MDKIKSEILLEKVKSSHIEGVGYNWDTKTLFIQFMGDRVYSYTPFTEAGFIAFKSAPSLGRFFEENIRKNKTLTCTEITEKVKVTYHKFQ